MRALDRWSCPAGTTATGVAPAATASFEDGTESGRGGCNSHSGTHALDGSEQTPDAAAVCAIDGLVLELRDESGAPWVPRRP